MLRRYIVIFGALSALTLSLGLSYSAAKADGCSISEFTMDPVDPYFLGQHVILHGVSNCGTVRFEIDGQPKAEIGSNEQTEIWKTEEYVPGNHVVCFVARGDGGWENADRRCRTVYVEGSQAPPPGSEPGDNVKCWINNFTVTPSSGPVGYTFQLAGQGQCDGNLRAIRFTIDGSPFGEYGGNTHGTSWNSSGYSVGSHQICFQATAGNWEGDAATSCVNITLSSSGPPSDNVQQGAQTDNGQAGQTPNSGPDGSDNNGAATGGNPTSNPGMDILGWCLSIGYESTSFGGDVYSWVCTKSGSAPKPMDPDAVCLFSNGSDYPYAGFLDQNDPYSWYCASTPQGRPGQSSEDDSGTTTDSSCPSAPSQLEVGDIAVVSDYDPYPIRARQQAGLDFDILFLIDPHEAVSIVSGPVCRDEYRWWEIGYNGLLGWSAEVGPSGIYNMIPNDQPLPGGASGGDSSENVCVGAKPPRMQVGGYGRIPYDGDGGTTALRVEPQGSVIQELSEGQEFLIIEGPVCTPGQQGNLNWWKVELDDGTVGWVPEGYLTTDYWIEPVDDSSTSGSSIDSEPEENPSDETGITGASDEEATETGQTSLLDQVLTSFRIQAYAAMEIGPRGTFPPEKQNQCVALAGYYRPDVFEWVGWEAVAKEWDDRANPQFNSYAKDCGITVDKNPRAGDIVVFDTDKKEPCWNIARDPKKPEVPPDGHVGYVLQVDGDLITFIHQNYWGSEETGTILFDVNNTNYEEKKRGPRSDIIQIDESCMLFIHQPTEECNRSNAKVQGGFEQYDDLPPRVPLPPVASDAGSEESTEEQNVWDIVTEWAQQTRQNLEDKGRQGLQDIQEFIQGIPDWVNQQFSNNNND